MVVIAVFAVLIAAQCIAGDNISLFWFSVIVGGGSLLAFFINRETMKYLEKKFPNEKLVEYAEFLLSRIPLSRSCDERFETTKDNPSSKIDDIESCGNDHDS